MKGWTVLVLMQFVVAVWCAAVPRSTVPEYSSTKLLKDVVGVISGTRATTTITSSPVLSGRTGLRFHPRVASTCFLAALHQFYYPMLNADKKETQKAICGIADQYDTCVAPYKMRSSPKEQMAFNFAIKGAKYLCTNDGYKNYLELAPCLSNVQVMNELNLCVQKLSHNANMNFCTMFDNYITCAVEATQTICTFGTSGKMKESLNILLSPIRESICLIKPTGSSRASLNPFVPKQKKLSRFRRQGFEEMAGLLGGSSLEEFAGQMTPPEFALGEMAGTSQMTPSEFAWGDLAGMSSQLTMPRFPLGHETATSAEQSIPGFSWEGLLTIPPYLTGHKISSEQVSTVSPDVTTPEVSSEEASTTFLDITTPDTSSEEVSTSTDVTTPEPGSEEVSTVSSDVTTPDVSSEEVSSASPDITTPEDSSEEVSTASPDVTTPEVSSEEVTTVSHDITPPEPGSEEVPTASPDITTPEASSEEVSTVSQDVTTPEPGSEEASTASPDITTPEDSSEEVSTAYSDVTTPEPGSEEVVTTSPDVTTPEPSLEEVSTTSVLDTTKPGPTTVTTIEIPSTTTTNEATTLAPIVTEPALVATSTPATIITVPEITTPAVTTSGSHAPPFQCYECHSGAHGYWQNSNCPANGHIDGWAALPNVCYGQCVSVVTRFPKGDVYRSCSTNYYFPFQIPYDGCFKYNQELFCFCSGDFCNNRDMSYELKTFILEALIVL